MTVKTPIDKERRPDRKNLGPTGPEHMPRQDAGESYEEKHPNPGNTGKSIPAVPPACDNEKRRKA
jgi:hypothetical protein